MTGVQTCALPISEVVRKVTNLDERQSLLVEVFDLEEEVERII